MRPSVRIIASILVALTAAAHVSVAPEQSARAWRASERERAITATIAQFVDGKRVVRNSTDWQAGIAGAAVPSQPASVVDGPSPAFRWESPTSGSTLGRAPPL